MMKQKSDHSYEKVSAKKPWYTLWYYGSNETELWTELVDRTAQDCPTGPIWKELPNKTV